MDGTQFAEPPEDPGYAGAQPDRDLPVHQPQPPQALSRPLPPVRPAQPLRPHVPEPQYPDDAASDDAFRRRESGAPVPAVRTDRAESAALVPAARAAHPNARPLAALAAVLALSGAMAWLINAVTDNAAVPQQAGVARETVVAVATGGPPVVAPALSPAASAGSRSASASPSASPSRSPSPSASATHQGSVTPATTGAAATSSAAVPPPPPAGPLPLTAGTHTVNRVFYQSGSLVLALTTVNVASSGRVTANVVYFNGGSSTILLGCSTVTNPAVNLLTRADGAVYRATNSFCSDNPQASFNLAPGQARDSYAVFDGVTGQNDAFTFTWQSGLSITGTLGGIVL
jgi:hypothetical protein